MSVLIGCACLPACACLQATRIQLAGNLLSGTAFPPAWAQPGGMEGMEEYELSGNSGLHGTLPTELAWPKLRSL